MSLICNLNLASHLSLCGKRPALQAALIMPLLIFTALRAILFHVSFVRAPPKYETFVLIDDDGALLAKVGSCDSTFCDGTVITNAL